ncbi:unnamed protein product [Mytilus coruscus]|uniref:Uncharacterized protein n=1 Tax=Mytilus coruscus TaxID=42192 RepID=A0A6J8EJW3_MYTCO|nr:unnamed protein product [Mytilus coruscus]
MATEGKESDIELSVEELEHIAAAFKEMGVKQKADSASDFKHWFQGTLKQPIKIEPVPPKAAASIETQSKGYQSRYIPRIVPFSGSDKDESYDLWKYEIECLQQEKYDEDVILQSMRRSFKGEAGKVAMRLGSKASVKDIMEKMEKEGEDVSAWGCRLEDMLSKVVHKKGITPQESKEKLRTRFWYGLRKELKDISGYKFDNITDFDQLRVVMREIEQDQLPNNKKTAHIKMAQSEGEYTELKSMMQQMNKDIGDLKRHTQEQLQRQDETRTEGQYQQSTHNNWNTQYRGRGHRGQGNRNYRPYWDNTQNTPLQAAETQQQTRRTPEKEPEATELNSYCNIDIRKEQRSDPVLKSWFTSIQQRRRPRRAEVKSQIANNLAPVDLTVDQPVDDSLIPGRTDDDRQPVEGLQGTGTEEDASPSVDEDIDDPVRLDYDANAVEPEVNTSDENPVNQNIDEESDSSDEPTPRPGRRSLPARTTRGKLPKKYDGFYDATVNQFKAIRLVRKSQLPVSSCIVRSFQGMEQVVTNAILKIVTD